MEQALEQLCARILAAKDAGTTLRIRGGGSKDWYGQSLQGEILDTRDYQGVIAYDPTELVITVRSGTALTDIESILAEHNQMLAFEPPHFGPGATIGGVVASGLSGPRRQAVGAVRDFVLGAVLVDDKGEVLHFGGQVMKNVAGYDISRLLAGSMGTLGLIAELSLKVLPKPFAETTLKFEIGERDALRCLNEWGGQPLPISASAWENDVLLLRLSGAEAAISAAKKKIGGEVVANAAPEWVGIREQQHPIFTASDQPLWRLSVPSAAAPIALAGKQMIEWGGALRWLKSDVDSATIRAQVKAVGGHATLFKGEDKSAGVFEPLAPAIAQIHRRLKSAFDPSGIFNPGRMYADY